MSRRSVLGALLILAPAAASGARSAGAAGDEPFPLGPEMVLLEKDAAAPAYRNLLRGMIPNDLNAEWQRVDAPDSAERFAEEHGGRSKLAAEPPLEDAYQRRKKIAEAFLSVLREEYKSRGLRAPDQEPAPESAPRALAAADPSLAIEPILPAPGADRQWPRWRGPGGQGLSTETDLPLRWGPAENIAWKTEVPGSGNSSPVIWGDRIWVTTAFEGGKRRSLVCLRRSDGSLLYVKDAPAMPPEGRVIAKNGYASATPAVDGERVVTFLGNTGLVAFDLDGKVLWHHPLPPFDAMHGTGASPVLCGDLAILFQEQSSKPSLGLALDKRTGEPRWRIERPRALGWCTPVPVRVAGQDQLIYGGTQTVFSYDPATGRELWRFRGPTIEVIPSVVWGHGLVYAASGRGGPTLAIRPVGTGDLTATNLAWRAPRGGPHVPSPVLAGEFLYQVSDTGILTCFRARSGEILYQKRLRARDQATRFSASPVAADGKVYLTGEEGDTIVLRQGPEFEVLEVSSLGEPTLASAAVLGKQIFIRCRSHLFAIGKPGATAAAPSGDAAPTGR